VTEHSPHQPSWNCVVCDKQWPCDPAREQLVAQYGLGASLAMLGWQYLEEAASAFPDGSPGELFDRFIRWTR
jgi:hypothetical protein